MSKRVTLYLRDEIIAIAREIAARSRRDVEDVLAEWIDEYADDVPVESLSDEQVLALCDFEMSPMGQYELRQLLVYHRERPLTEDEDMRLDRLLQTYRKGIVRKAKAVQVAMMRGIREDPYADETGDSYT